MKFSEISDSFERMESTTKRLELTDILVELLKKTPIEIISRVVYLIQGKLRPNFEGVELGVADDVVFERTNSKKKDGAVGILTHGIINRTKYYKEAVIMSLIPFVNKGLSF